MNRQRDDWTAYAETHGLIRDRQVATVAPAPKRTNKYGAIKTTAADGRVFDSKHEARRYEELKLRQAAGEIADLELQPKFPLHVMRLCCSGPIQLVTVATYVADFAYTDLRSGECVVEDAKGCRTPVYILKRKLAEAIHGLTITEV